MKVTWEPPAWRKRKTKNWIDCTSRKEKWIDTYVKYENWLINWLRVWLPHGRQGVHFNITTCSNKKQQRNNTIKNKNVTIILLGTKCTKWCNSTIVPHQQPAAKQTCGEEESTGEPVGCLSSSCRPCGGLLFFSLTSRFTPFSKPVLVRGGQQHCSRFRLVCWVVARQIVNCV